MHFSRWSRTAKLNQIKIFNTAKTFIPISYVSSSCFRIKQCLISNLVLFWFILYNTSRRDCWWLLGTLEMGYYLLLYYMVRSAHLTSHPHPHHLMPKRFCLTLILISNNFFIIIITPLHSKNGVKLLTQVVVDEEIKKLKHPIPILGKVCKAHSYK
jgi:hypothetical protein